MVLGPEYHLSCWNLLWNKQEWIIIPWTTRMLVAYPVLDSILFSHHVSAQAAISPDESKMVVSSLYDGFDVYSINNQRRIRTLPIYILENLSLPITFIQDHETVLLGSSQGAVRIVIISSGEILHTLRHDWDIVQAISYHHQPRASIHYIATATSKKAKATYGKIWKADGWKYEECTKVPPNEISQWVNEVDEEPNSQSALGWRIFIVGY
ncbi:hypothetical protein L208DRAFT_1381562 [Tricholoma matsutake]|nr:hypothetical protein L208DRAFT_1381562 [Tricholoma matsutake 945]